MEDRRGLDTVLAAARRRVKKHRELQAALEPLERFVRSWSKGSYRPEDRGHVALAIAAFVYVQSPLDAIPDQLPGGLRDDARVVAWVTNLLRDELTRYEEWEASVGTPFLQADLTTEANVFLDRLTSSEVRVLDPHSSALFASSLPRSLRPVALGTAAAAAASLAEALQPGQVMQVLGPSHLLAGLKDGSYTLMQTADGATGTVMGGNGIAGNLRFGDPEKAASAAAAPLAIFQVASAVTLQYYLDRIDRQLAEIDAGVKALEQGVLDEKYGQISAAWRASCEVQSALDATGSVGPADQHRLLSAEAEIDKAYYTLLRGLEEFSRKALELERGTATLKDWKGMLEEGARSKRLQMSLLLLAAAVRHRINGLGVSLAAQESPARGELAAAKFDNEHSEMLRGLTEAGDAFRRLGLPKREMDERFGFLGGPEQELVEFWDATAQLRAALDRPTELLPSLDAGQPYLLELMKREDGTVEERTALVGRAA